MSDCQQLSPPSSLLAALARRNADVKDCISCYLGGGYSQDSTWLATEEQQKRWMQTLAGKQGAPIPPGLPPPTRRASTVTTEPDRAASRLANTWQVGTPLPQPPLGPPPKSLPKPHPRPSPPPLIGPPPKRPPTSQVAESAASLRQPPPASPTPPPPAACTLAAGTYPYGNYVGHIVPPPPILPCEDTSS